MPTNLKSLLGRSRSRNELKAATKEKEGDRDTANNTTTTISAESGGNGAKDYCSCCSSSSCTNGSTCEDCPINGEALSSHYCYRNQNGFVSVPNTTTTPGPDYEQQFPLQHCCDSSCTVMIHNEGGRNLNNVPGPRLGGGFGSHISMCPATATTCTSSSSNEWTSHKHNNSPGTCSQYAPSSLSPDGDCSFNKSHHHHHPHPKLSSMAQLYDGGGEPHLLYPGLPMRKCETVVTLSTYAGNGATTTAGTRSSSNIYSPPDLCTSLLGSNNGCCGNPTGGTTGSCEKPGKLGSTKNKVLSTSSSTLSCLLHSTSSSRSKLFSSWKLSSGGASGGSNSSCSPDYHCHHQDFTPVSSSKLCLFNEPNGGAMFKSQLSVSENGGCGSGVPMTPLNRLRRNVSINNTFYCGGGGSSFSRSSSVASFGWTSKGEDDSTEVLCRLCLCHVRGEETIEISACSCRYCKDCIMAYITFEIQEGAEEIACPDAGCEKQGAFALVELESLIPQSLMEKHKKFRFHREVEKNVQLMWCPSPGCETVCRIQESVFGPGIVDGGGGGGNKSHHKSREGSPHNKSLTINCSTCRNSFCAECKLSCHPGTSCEAFRRKMIKQGKLVVDDEEVLSLDCIKKCPFCHVPIEKDSGCAQMMCKKCKHVFCWYCLASLDDDFLLRHYDKGPCKNKLGHSRASVIWHRAQVIGIFAGFGVLVLLASPLLILAAPCLLCCRCRYCSKGTDDTPMQV